MRACVCRSSSCDRHELAIIQNQKRIAGGALNEAPLRRVDAVISKLECAVVDRDAHSGAKDLMRSDGFIGAHMHPRHEPARLAGSDRQQRQPWRPETFADLSEMIAKTRISREIDDAVRRRDYIPAPQGPIPVEQRSGRKMQCGYAVNGA